MANAALHVPRNLEVGMTSFTGWQRSSFPLVRSRKKDGRSKQQACVDQTVSEFKRLWHKYPDQLKNTSEVDEGAEGTVVVSLYKKT